MRDFFTPTFLKFLTRFILLVLVGVIGALIAGQINTEQKEANIIKTETPTEISQ